MVIGSPASAIWAILHIVPAKDSSGTGSSPTTSTPTRRHGADQEHGPLPKALTQCSGRETIALLRRRPRKKLADNMGCNQIDATVTVHVIKPNHAWHGVAFGTRSGWLDHRGRNVSSSANTGAGNGRSMQPTHSSTSLFLASSLIRTFRYAELLV
jgi:hypothetical protein